MTDVRSLLHDLAAEAPRGHGEDTADRVADLRRTQDRRRLRWAGVAAAVAVVVAVVPTALGTLRSADRAATSVESVGATSLFDVPTRGSLADDAGLVESARTASWGEGIPLRDAGDVLDPAPENRHVAFLGEVPGGQVWALVIGRAGTQLAYAWFVADESGAWRLVGLPERTSDGLPIALVDGAGDHGPLVVVGLPDEDVALVPFGGAPSLPDVHSMRVDAGVALADVATPDGTPTLGYEVSGAANSPQRTFRPLQFDSADRGSVEVVIGQFAAAVSDPATGPAVRDCLADNGWLAEFEDGSASWPFLATDEDAAFLLAALESCRVAAGAGD